MTQFSRPFPKPGGIDRKVDDDKRPIEDLQSAVGTLPIVKSGSKVESAKTDRQAFVLGNAEYPMTKVVSTERTDVFGQGADITSNLEVPANAKATFVGCRFLGTISVGAGAVLTLHNCEVTKELAVAVNGKVHAFGVLFSGTGRVNNAGGALLVSIHGSHRTSGLPHLNVTVFSEST
jgi:hypothetical protein